MNLRLIANAATQRVNPNTTIALLQSTGYTTDINGKRTATNQVVMLGSCNIQALTTGDLRHVEGLNIQGNHRSVYIYGKIAGVIRTNKEGGDILQFAEIPNNPLYPIKNWVVTAVVEQWPDWCHVIATEQQ